jgi:hypothetical protein
MSFDEALRRMLCVVAAVLCLAPAAIVEAHDTEITPLVVGSSEPGGGVLVVVREQEAPIHAERDFASDGLVLYTAADPSFETPADGGGPPFPLADGTKVTVEVTAVGDTVAMKLRGATLADVGASVLLGTAPALHAHPEWQLTLADGATGCQSLAFRLTADGGYAPSDEHVVQVTNDDDACGGGSTPVCGDADESGAITVTDGVATLRTAAGLSGGCVAEAACDVDGSGAVSVTDGVNVLRAAAGLATDLTCPDL